MKRTELLVILAVAAFCRATGSLVTTAHAGLAPVGAASAHQPGTPTQPLFPARALPQAALPGISYRASATVASTSTSETKATPRPMRSEAAPMKQAVQPADANGGLRPAAQAAHNPELSHP